MKLLEINNKLKKNYFHLITTTFFILGFFSSSIGNISAQEEIFPMWLKTTAVWWGEEKITDQDFINILQYLVDKKLLVLQITKLPESLCGPGMVLDEINNECVIHDKSDSKGIFIDAIDDQQKIVVSWIKVTTLWWGQDKLSDQDFINALEYLVENNVIKLESNKLSKSPDSLNTLPTNTLVGPKIGKIVDFRVQGHKNTDLYQLQFNLLDVNQHPITPDGTISIVIMDDENRILYLDAFSIRKYNYEKSYNAFSDTDKGKDIFTWKIKTSDIKSGFTEYGKAKLMFTDRYGNNIESEFIQISIPQFN